VNEIGSHHPLFWNFAGNKGKKRGEGEAFETLLEWTPIKKKGEKGRAIFLSEEKKERKGLL